MMSCSFSLQIPKAMPSLSAPPRRPFLTSKHNQIQSTDVHKKRGSLSLNEVGYFDAKKMLLAVQAGAAFAAFEQPALAVTGANNEPEPDLLTVVIKLGIVAIWYFLVMPPIIMNWLRIRWYRRKLLEMYLQFMFVFLFFPAIMLWAPFINVRKFPRDPSMKYPWDTPKDPSQIKNAYLKYPWAEPDDYA